MADNLTYNGTGSTVPAGTIQKTDDTPGGHVPFVKLLDGTLNSEIGIPGDAANGLDVDVTRVQGTVTVAGTVGISGTVTTNGSGVTQPVSAAALPLPTGASTETTLASRLSESDFDTKTGALTETAPASDTASSGLNGRLQRIAQRLTSLIALLPTALTGSGNLKTAIVETTVTQPVSNAGTFAVQAAQSGTWPVRAQDGSGNALTSALRGAERALSIQIVDAAGAQLTFASGLQPATGTLANVAGSASSVTLQASNASRRSLVVFNDSDAVLYVKFGSAASVTSFTYKLDPYVTLELPAPSYTGIVTGIWSSALGNARVTELT